MQLLKSQNQKSNILPLFAIGTLGLHLLSLLVLLFHWSLLQRLNGQTMLPSLVQLVDGRTMSVQPQSSWLRHPQAIRRFVGESLSLMLTWSPKQPPSVVWDVSSQLVRDDFHVQFQAQMLKLIGGKSLAGFNGSTEQILVIQRISQPEVVAEGKWRLELLGHQLVFQGSDRLGVSIPVHKQVFVAATDELVADFSPQPLHRSVFRLGEARLQIYKLCDFHDHLCLESSP